MLFINVKTLCHYTSLFSIQQFIHTEQDEHENVCGVYNICVFEFVKNSGFLLQYFKTPERFLSTSIGAKVADPPCVSSSKDSPEAESSMLMNYQQIHRFCWKKQSSITTTQLNSDDRQISQLDVSRSIPKIFILQ